MADLDITGLLRELTEAGVDFFLIGGADEFSPDELPDPLDPAALETGGNWVLTTRLGRLDIMQWIGDIDLWAEMSGHAVSDELANLKIKVVAYHDLVRLKELAGRPEDLTDIERLREVRDE